MRKIGSQIEHALHELKRYNDTISVLLDGADECPLGPGVHTYSLKELEDDFAFNATRQRLFNKLSDLAKDLRAAGCTRLYLGGSFITRKAVPGDFDACWDPHGVDFNKLDPSLACQIPEKARAKYGGDVFMAAPNVTGFDHLRHFQLDKQGETKGIIKIEL